MCGTDSVGDARWRDNLQVMTNLPCRGGGAKRIPIYLEAVIRFRPCHLDQRIDRKKHNRQDDEVQCVSLTEPLKPDHQSSVDHDYWHVADSCGIR
jgi:hypothetical protein